jgi:hypothetical protein
MCAAAITALFVTGPPAGTFASIERMRNCGTLANATPSAATTHADSNAITQKMRTRPAIEVFVRRRTREAVLT